MNGKSVQNSRSELMKDQSAAVSQQDIRLKSLSGIDDRFADENDKLKDGGESAESGTKNRGRELSMFTKICFAMSGLTYQMYFCAISVYATVFLLNSAGLPPTKNLVILFVSRIIDAITDVVYGYFVEKSPITRYGKMKPWIFFSIPVSALSYVMMWYIPESFSENGLFVWFLFWHSLFFTVLTGIRIPHTAMTMYLCSSLEERESATIYRMGMEMVGLLLALAIQGPFMANIKCIQDNLINLNETTNMSLPAAFDDESHLKEVFRTVKDSQTVWEKNIYVIFAAILTVIFLIGNYMLVFFVDEKKELLEASDKSKTSQENQIRTKTELKRIFTFRPYVLLAMATILSTSAVQVVQANMELYFKYGYDALADQFAYAILILLVFGCLFVPIWKYFMLKVEKKYLYIIGNLTMVPLMIGTFFFKTSQIGEVVVFYGLSVISANCFTAVFLIPWAMLPEVLDAYFLQYRTRPDAFFFTLFNLGSKIFMAVYFGLTQLVLSLVNYKNNYCTQDEGVKTAVINLFSPVSIGLLISGSIFVYFYPIDSAKAKENSQRIKELNQEERF